MTEKSQKTGKPTGRKTDKLTEVFLAGRYLDTIVLEDSKPLFSERFASTIPPSSPTPWSSRSRNRGSALSRSGR